MKQTLTRLDVRDFGTVFLDANLRRLRQQWQDAIDQRKPARTIAAALAAYQEAKADLEREKEE